MAFKKVSKSSLVDNGPHVQKRKYIELETVRTEQEEDGTIRYIGRLNGMEISVVNSRNGMGFATEDASGKFSGRMFLLVEHDGNGRNNRLEDADGRYLAAVREKDEKALVRDMDGNIFETSLITHADAMKMLEQAVTDRQSPYAERQILLNP